MHSLLEEAVGQCRNSELEGIELIEYAQNLVNRTMKYSFANSFDLPATAFAKGYGYCWHQASILRRILRELGFDCKLVYAVKTRIPEKLYQGIVIKEHLSGHVWCNVQYGGNEGDVCPGDENNRFGSVHFNCLSEIKNWNVWIGFWAYWGSAVVNMKRQKQLNQLKNMR